MVLRKFKASMSQHKILFTSLSLLNITAYIHTAFPPTQGIPLKLTSVEDYFSYIQNQRMLNTNGQKLHPFSDYSGRTNNFPLIFLKYHLFF